ncbi:MAG: tetratricopeptide repeat protein [Myxococcota bacterium]
MIRWFIAITLMVGSASAFAQNEADPNAPVDPNADPNAPADPAADPNADPGANPATEPAPQPRDQPRTATGEVPLPSFLDTTDRRIVDERPPPTPEQIQALREMEAEVARFDGSGGSYRNTVVSLLRREYLRQRRGRDQWYGRQIREEERLLDEARERAIRQFERFIRRYPDDPTYTPDAMFRLGELYYERSSIDFQRAYDQAQAQRDAGETEVDLPETPDFNPTIELYQRLVRAFPDYRRLDGVYYLIGYCLNEMGRLEEARDAWLALVCSNRYQYDPDRVAREAAEAAAAEEAAGEGEDPAEEHPALSLDVGEDGEAAEAVGFVNPYSECRPITDEAQFLSETWFRIGEYHFDDYADPHALELSIAAYNRILEDPEDRNYNLALYKVAWAYYRASRYPEAIQNFGRLVQWSDDERARTGEAGSQLRPEAIQYLGIAFAYDDWNENGLPDTIDGMPDGITRIQDGQLLPQDRDWTPEVYFQLGQVYFDEAKYPEAVRVWRLALSRWPNHRMAPAITNQIAQAHQRNNEFNEAIAARSELAQFLPGGEWSQNNLDNPAEQREAEQLAENALIATAIHEHTSAQRERRHSVEMANAGDAEGALRTFEVAKQHYQRAATAYREYLRRYPNNPQAYELQYNLADALYWSSSYEEAAREYAAVRDSNLDDVHLSESARRVVESLKNILDDAERNGTIQIRADPPTPEGTPPSVRPVEMPELLQRMAQARELYIARVSDAQDTEGVRAAYDYNNAVLLYQYGYWPQAKERFERIFNERCSGPYADETGQVAWESMLNMAEALQDTEETRRLVTLLSERQCTFSSDGESCPPRAELQEFCQDEENLGTPCCRMMEIQGSLAYRDALEIFQQGENAQGEQRMQLFERSATMLINAVNRDPTHEQAPIALEYAARALEETQRFDSARQIYQRIIDEVAPRTSEDPSEQQNLDRIVGNAYFRVAYNANRGFEFEEAVRNYRILVDSPRFRASSDDRIKEFRRDALANTAIIYEQLQRYNEAVRYYRNLYDSNDASADLKRTALYRIAEIAFNRRDWNRTIREMRAFISRYQREAAAGELVVQAYWRIAQARKNMRQTRDYQNALRDVVQAFGRSGQPPSSLAAEYAANAAFLLADEGSDEFERFAISEGRPRTLEDYVQSLTRQIDEGAVEAQRFVDGYNTVPPYRRPRWTIAAYVQQGRIYELLARAVLNAPVPFVLPAAMQQQLRGRRMNRDTREEIRIVIEDTVRQVLDQKTRPIECFAVARYALAARAARVGSIDDEYTRSAIDRLQAYGDERIAECIAEAQARDNTFQAYQPGEFSRAPRGQIMSIDPGITPPALDR